ncbi:hypothetical protein FA95DRAFT_854148 [Auriscalpium vulgare]|uniref:Uncharacterized protein n=1 Tax=Auriscalpium vulgare TaxID=40419 RepID=A0ACB8R9I4_9AGAM|nr:hypothetical protein FA95DRAFT_854148 [Auriscalpium vulgare]
MVREHVWRRGEPGLLVGEVLGLRGRRGEMDGGGVGDVAGPCRAGRTRRRSPSGVLSVCARPFFGPPSSMSMSCRSRTSRSRSLSLSRSRSARSRSHSRSRSRSTRPSHPSSRALLPLALRSCRPSTRWPLGCACGLVIADSDSGDGLTAYSRGCWPCSGAKRIGWGGG